MCVVEVQFVTFTTRFKYIFFRIIWTERHVFKKPKGWKFYFNIPSNNKGLCVDAALTGGHDESTKYIYLKETPI